MPRACWGSQSWSGRSQRRLFRFTLQFRRRQPGRVERLQRAEPGPSSRGGPAAPFVGPNGRRLRTVWHVEAIVRRRRRVHDRRLKLRVRRLPKRRAEGRQPDRPSGTPWQSHRSRLDDRVRRAGRQLDCGRLEPGGHLVLTLKHTEQAATKADVAESTVSAGSRKYRRRGSTPHTVRWRHGAR